MLISTVKGKIAEISLNAFDTTNPKAKIKIGRFFEVWVPISVELFRAEPTIVGTEVTATIETS